MPIMAPVADIVGLSRQTAVLAYCFGDGFSDMFWPTNCSLQCGLMGIPPEPVVPIHHTAVLHHGGAAVPVYGHFRLCVLSLSRAGLPSSAGTSLPPRRFPYRRGALFMPAPPHTRFRHSTYRFPIGERGWSFR